ncbi:MAG: hypothetical protein RL272_974 [Candidatus Parcubacteria bacterium]
MTVRDALIFGAHELKAHRCDAADPVRESEALLEAATGMPRERFFSDPSRRLTAAQARRYGSFLARRSRHEPLAYLLGSAWFLGREFAVDARVLIPRPATEHVAEAAIEAAKSRRATLFVDVGTGSGCIAVSAALSLPRAAVLATDSSASALAVARRNARRHGASGQVSFRKGDLAAPALASLRRADGAVLVANLPYIPAGSMRRASPCVRREPRQALVGGQDGLGHFRRLLKQLSARRRMAPASLFFEMLPGQYAALEAEVKKNFPGVRAGKILNFESVCVGLRADI